MSIIKSKGKLWSTGTTEYYTIVKNNELEATGVNTDISQ